MRLTLFHPSFLTVGGAELLAASQVAWLRAQGVEVRVVTFGFDAARWGGRFDGIPVTIVAGRHWSDLLVANRPLAKLRRRARRAAPALRDADRVLASNYPCSAMLGEAGSAARRVWQCNEPPKSLHVRGANPVLTARVEATAGRGPEDVCAPFARKLAEHDRARARGAAVEELAAFDVDRVSRLDEIFAISAFSRDNARRIYGRCSEEVVPPMVRFPDAVAPRAGLDRSGLQVLVHSRLERPKNIDTVLRGFARFREAGCARARLHVVGEGGHRARLEALAVELRAAEAIRFHGFLGDAELRRVYAACDVMALLPIDEPFGMVYPEAAAHGLLLVGPDHGGPMEILEGGALGWVCDAFSPEALADALSRVWALGDAEADRRRADADRACRARYSADAVGRLLLRALG